MSEEGNVLDFEWGETPEVAEGIQEIWEFGTYRFATMKRVSFAKGKFIEVPEIQIDGEPFRRNGMKEGGNLKAYFLENTLQNAQGEDYTYVEVLTTATNIKLTKAQIEAFPNIYVTDSQQKALDKNGEAWFSLMSNLTQPGLNLIPKETFAKIAMGKPFHAKSQVITYAKRKRDEVDEEGNPKYWYDTYKTNWHLFDTREEVLAAKKENWEESGNNSTSAGYQYPSRWKAGTEEETLQWVKDEIKGGADLKTTATTASLTAEHTPDYKKILEDIVAELFPENLRPAIEF